jgi:putative FmdB family regulatory protein
MPIYEYVCKACGAESEIMQKLSDPPAKECPVCHKKKLVKNISAAGFRLSGGGWYETDFKSGNKRNVAGDKAEAKPESKPEAKAEGKTETKTDGAAAKPAASEKPVKSEAPKKPKAESPATR